MPHGKLLVVEDDEAIRSLLAEYFKERSHVAVDTARDGAEALHRVSRNAYSVVVLDLIMPHMSGIDFLVSLQALISDPSLKALASAPAVLVVTSAAQEDFPSCDIENRFPKIVRGVLRKPFDFDELGGRVDALL